MFLYRNAINKCKRVLNMLFLFEVLNRRLFTPNKLIPNGNRTMPSVMNNMNHRTILQQTVPTRREQLSQMIINRQRYLNNVNKPVPDSEKNMKA